MRYRRITKRPRHRHKQTCLASPNLNRPRHSSVRSGCWLTHEEARPRRCRWELRLLRNEAGSSLSMRHLFQERRRALAPSAIAARCSIRPIHLSLRPRSDWSRQGHVFRASASRSSTRLRIPSSSSIGRTPTGLRLLCGAQTRVARSSPAESTNQDLLSDLNSFKIPILWGVKNTAPYFHDNSAKTLADVAAHYARFFLTLPDPVILTPQDQADIVAYLKLLN